MNSNRLGIYVSAILIAISLFACQKENHPPDIQSLTIAVDTVQPGDTVNLYCYASDEDGDEVSYTWSCDEGLILFPSNPLSNSAQWIAPDNPGEFFINVKASDGELMTESSLHMQVTGLSIFTDPRDGNVYQYVKIVTQTWMAENLAYLPTVNHPDQLSETEAHYYVYGFEGSIVHEAKAIDNYKDYGVLYNWEAAMEACPEEWHLPSDEEWITLEKLLGMSEYHLDYWGFRPSREVSIKLKSSYGWKDDKNGINSLGFNALPGGWYTAIGSFTQLTETASFWSSKPYKSSFAMHLDLYHYAEGVYWYYITRKLGYSVRCVKDE